MENKHAILIQGYRQFRYVRSQIEKMWGDDPCFYTFIHWDKRYEKDLTEDDRVWIENSPRVHFISIHEVNWGSFGQAKATLSLCEEALKTDATYFHLISDMDMMIPDKETFKDFFKNNQTSYLNYINRGHGENSSSAWRSMAVYHRTEKYDYHHDPEAKRIYEEEIRDQLDRRMYRELPDCDFYSGSQWWSLRREKIEYLVSQKDWIYKYFVDTRVCDEIFVQTVIMNAPEEIKKNIYNANMRYLVWGYKNGNCPAHLDEYDYDAILRSWRNSHSLFVRKIDIRYAGRLIEKLNKAHENFQDAVNKIPR